MNRTRRKAPPAANRAGQLEMSISQVGYNPLERKAYCLPLHEARRRFDRMKELFRKGGAV